MGKKLSHAESGRRGGMKGGLARVKKGFSMLTKEERKALAKRAIETRWKKYRESKQCPSP